MNTLTLAAAECEATNWPEAFMVVGLGFAIAAILWTVMP